MSEMDVFPATGFHVWSTGERVRRLVPRPGEVWWLPGAAHYHLEPIPHGIEYKKIADHAVFGTEAEARAAGVLTPCSKCARILRASN
jgi:hypothetical protein